MTAQSVIVCTRFHLWNVSHTRLTRLSIYVLASLLLLLIIGCSNKELSRKEAEKFITAYYEYPNVEVNRRDASSDSGRKNIQWLENNGYLVSKGLLGYSETPSAIPYKVHAMGNSGVPSFATNMRRLKEVTGIRYDTPDKTKATVEFTVERYNITPFGKYRFSENEEVRYEVMIERYDDGWRITTPNRKNYKEADFPDVEEFLEN